MTKNVFWMDVGQYFPLNMVNDVLNLKIFIIWVMQIILNFFSFVYDHYFITM